MISKKIFIIIVGKFYLYLIGVLDFKLSTIYCSRWMAGGVEVKPPQVSPRLIIVRCTNYI